MNSDDLRRNNPHWKEHIYKYKYERKMFEKLKKELKYDHITAITGPRRVGKTVLMRQVITHLIENNVSPKNILYFGFDEKNIDLKELIRIWEREFNIDLWNKEHYLFLDEIQNVDSWAEKIKTLYDVYEGKLKIFISGSASLSVRKGKESLAGRIIEFFVNPLDYEEYLNFAGIKVNAKLYNYYYEYMFRQLPALAIGKEDLEVYTKSIVEKIIYSDAVKYYDISDPDLLKSMFKIIVGLPGQILDYDGLSKELNAERHTISKYIDVLEKSYLIRKCYNYSNNIRKTERKLKKYYPYFTTLLNFNGAIKPNIGSIAETEVRLKTNAEYFHNKNHKEIDFIILDERDRKIGVEIKARNNISLKNIKYLLNNKLDLYRKILVVLPDSNLDYKIKEEQDLEVINIMELEKVKQ